MRLPTEAEIAEINARHLIETPLRPADLLFVFGTRADVSERVDEACRLWREGYFRYAIVSGGITPGSGLSECEIIADAMVARGEDPPCPSLAGARHQDPRGTAVSWLARDEQAQRELSVSLPDAVTPPHPRKRSSALSQTPAQSDNLDTPKLAGVGSRVVPMPGS